ncbi:MAG TPA: tetratricopeptide repeat protein [Methylomirabilota bacterium]
MTRARRASPTIRIAGFLLLSLAVSMPAWAQTAPAAAAAKVRSVVILPFATPDLPREEAWLGEAAAQSIMTAFRQVPGLIQVDRARLKSVPQPELWDESSAVAAARAVRADIAIFGEVRRTAGDLTIQGRWVELRGERVERGQLDPVVVPEGGLLDRLRALPVAYTKAIKILVTEPEAARMQKWAAPTSSPKAWEAYVRGAIAANRGTQDGNEAAVEHLSRAIEADAQFVLAQYMLGSVHQAMGNRWKASAQFRASSQLDPTFPDAYKALGDLFLTAPRRLFDQAEEAYSKAIDLRPFYAEAYVGLGDAKAAKGDVDGAIGAYQKALIHNPLSGKVYASLGKIYYSEKSLYYESVQAYRKAVDLDPVNTDARMGLAEVYEDKGLYPEAIGEYKKVVELDPRNTGALYNLALVYEKVDPKESITLWERYIQLAGSQPTEKDWVDVAKLHLRKLKNQFEKDK